jgi:peptide/nickel transport system permease protein
MITPPIEKAQNVPAKHALSSLDLTAGPQAELKHRTHWANVWSYFRRDRFAVSGGFLALLLFAMAAGAPWLSPFDPMTQFPDGLAGDFGLPVSSNARFLLGTDSLGRDFLSRLLWGGRISLTVSVFASVISVSVAVVVGGMAGYLGGWMDTAIMRFIDLALSFPTLLLQIALATVLPPSLVTVIVVITIFGWVFPARMFRGQILSLRERPFVEAARAVGAPPARIFFRHLLPQLLPTIIVFSTLRIPAYILTEAGLSFLGLGVRPPTPSWGNLILEGARFYRTAPWLVLYPGFCITLTVLSFNLLGDGLRDALDPRQWRLIGAAKGLDTLRTRPKGLDTLRTRPKGLDTLRTRPKDR